MGKILLVGGAGYVGSVLVAEMLERGYAVRVLDRFYFGDQGLAEVRDRIELVQGDMRAPPSEIMQDIDAVVNLGGLSNDPTAEYNPLANRQMNTEASVALARMCVEQGVPRYVFASTCSVYDRGIGQDAADFLQDETSAVDPRAAYSSSKYAAEKELLALASDSFCVAILRKGTLYGFSPRMRYDLVVNTFIKDALDKGYLTMYYGGEMWRPLLDVRDAARAYIACIEADAAKVNGEIFNLAYRNLRISELALRVRSALAEVGVQADIRPDYSYKGVRSYRVSGKKIEQVLGFQPLVSVEESVVDIVENIRRYDMLDLGNPRYYNIRWMQMLEEAQNIIQITGSVFEVCP